MHLISVKLVRRGERMGRHESDQHSETSVDGLRKKRERETEGMEFRSLFPGFCIFCFSIEQGRCKAGNTCTFERSRRTLSKMNVSRELVACCSYSPSQPYCGWRGFWCIFLF